MVAEGRERAAPKRTTRPLHGERVRVAARFHPEPREDIRHCRRPVRLLELQAVRPREDGLARARGGDNGQDGEDIRAGVHVERDGAGRRERAEMRAEIQEVEQAMLTELDDTQIAREKMGAQKLNAVMSGLGPLLGLVLPLIPFVFAGTILTLLQATILSVAVAVGVLFLFGAYMASISRQRWYIAGIRMGLAGIVVAIISVFLPG